MTPLNDNMLALHLEHLLSNDFHLEHKDFSHSKLRKVFSDHEVLKYFVTQLLSYTTDDVNKFDVDCLTITLILSYPLKIMSAKEN